MNDPAFARFNTSPTRKRRPSAPSMRSAGTGDFMDAPPTLARRAGTGENRRLSRRTVLRGVGASLTLPWLDSLAWAKRKADRTAGAVDAADRPPVRFATLLFANGVDPAGWQAEHADGPGDAGGLRLRDTLEPLAPHRDRLTVLKGLHVFNDTSGPHWPLFSNLLSGARFQPSLTPRGAISIDQAIARHTGKLTPVPSLVLAVEPAESGLRGGVPSVYYGTVSWSSPSTPIAPAVYPRAVFDRLFDTSGLLRDRSVLDAVLAQSKDVRRTLGAADRQKLDEFSSSVREMELRIDRATAEKRLEGWRPTLEEPDMDRPPEERPQDVRDHMAMMLDLLTLAFRMDRTRVATLIFNRDVSHMTFGFLDGVSDKQLHGISHHGNKAARLKEYRAVNRFHVERFAGLVERMAAIDDGAGTSLLDNVMLLFGSNMADGNKHDGRDLPLILAGGGGGTLPGGRLLDLSERPEEEQRACNLYVSLAERMGVSLPNFGDSVGPLRGLDG